MPGMTWGEVEKVRIDEADVARMAVFFIAYQLIIIKFFYETGGYLIIVSALLHGRNTLMV